MTNFLPDEFREELEGLQDQVPPRPYRDIEARLREEFGGRAPDRAVRGVRARAGRLGVDRPGPPRAPAARGEEVAVKVQYPDIEEIVRIDLRALRRIFGVLRWFVPDHGLDTIYREIREMVLEELDYRREAAAIERIAANFARAQAPAAASASRASWPSSRRRACSPPSGSRGAKVADLERLDEPGGRSARGGARLRRGLLPADLHRRRLPRRSAPREPAGPAAAGAGRRRPRSCSSTSARSRRVARGCGAGSCRSCRAR